MSPREERSKSPNKKPPVADVRTAVLHLAELAAAFEGRGTQARRIDDGSDDDTLAKDGEFLAEVVALILRHRRAQRKRQCQIFDAAALDLLSEAYDADDYRSSESTAVRERLILEMFSRFLIEPTSDEAKRLAILPTRNKRDVKSTERNVHDYEGPVDAAKATISRIVLRGTRALAESRRWADCLPLARVAFGRHVGRAARDEYMEELRISEPKTAETLPFPLSALQGDMDERTGLAIDIAGEELSRTLFTTTEGLHLLFSEPAGSSRVQELQNEFKARWWKRFCLCIALIDVAPEPAEEYVQLVPGLGERARSAVRTLVSARETRDDATAESALSQLASAIWDAEIESIRMHHLRRLETKTPRP